MQNFNIIYIQVGSRNTANCFWHRQRRYSASLPSLSNIPATLYNKHSNITSPCSVDKTFYKTIFISYDQHKIVYV